MLGKRKGLSIHRYKYTANMCEATTSRNYFNSKASSISLHFIDPKMSQPGCFLQHLPIWLGQIWFMMFRTFTGVVWSLAQYLIKDLGSDASRKGDSNTKPQIEYTIIAFNYLSYLYSLCVYNRIFVLRKRWIQFTWLPPNMHIGSLLDKPKLVFLCINIMYYTTTSNRGKHRKIKKLRRNIHLETA